MNTIAPTVTANGMNCLLPSFHILRKRVGLASLKPVTSSTAASAASGMRLRSVGTSSRLPRSRKPWKIVDARVRPPDCAFTELRMITDVIGRPPSAPAAMLPTPCATSSRLGGEARRSGSSLSVASRLRSVSSDATTASVAPASSTFVSFQREKSGNCTRSSQPTSPWPSTGTCTRWDSSMVHACPERRSSSLSATPSSTAASAPGKRERFRNATRSQVTSSARQAKPTVIAAGTNASIAPPRCCRVVVPSGAKKDMSPS